MKEADDVMVDEVMADDDVICVSQTSRGGQEASRAHDSY